MRRLGSVLLLLAAGALFVLELTAAPTASARCVGPSITLSSQDVDRGDQLTVAGMGWGDDCHDTGSPPKGEGVLGPPVEDIEIVLDQDGEQRILATVDAADDYRFEVQVTVPHDVIPGPARLFARAPEWDLPIESDIPGLGADLVIGEAAPAASPSTTDAAAPSTDPKPDDQEPSEPTRSESGSRSTWILAIGVSVACAVAIGAGFVLVRRRSAPSIPVDR